MNETPYSVRPLVMVGLMNFNQKEDTLRCLQSLRQVRQPPISVVLVDNASSDGSVAMIREGHPEVKLIVSPENRGCAGGRNILLEYFLSTDTEYLLFLDNDTEVLPDTIRLLLEEMNRSQDVHVMGIKAYYQDRPKIFWSKGGAVFNPWKGRFEGLGQREEDTGQYDKMEEVDSIPGGFTFLKRRVAEKVPRIDERYFIYFEDSDWCLRVKRAGFKIVSSGKAKVYHKASSSLGSESPLFYYYRTRNLFLFMADHAPQYMIPFAFYYFGCTLPNLLLSLWLSKQKRQIVALFLGISDFINRRWYACSHPSIL